MTSNMLKLTTLKNKTTKCVNKLGSLLTSLIAIGEDDSFQAEEEKELHLEAV